MLKCWHVVVVTIELHETVGYILPYYRYIGHKLHNLCYLMSMRALSCLIKNLGIKNNDEIPGACRSRFTEQRAASTGNGRSEQNLWEGGSLFL